MRYAEQRMWQAQTQAFILQDPVMLVLNRPVSDSVRNDSAGGRLPFEEAGESNPLAAQQVRIIPARSRSTSLTYITPVGEVIESKDKILIGMPSLDVRAHDWFTWMGKAFVCVFIEPDRTYQTKVQLDLLGEGPRETV